MFVSDLFEICESNDDSELMLVAIVKDEKYPICSQYVESNVLYLFTDDRKQHDSNSMAYYIEQEAQDECWYDWRNGSTFLDCEVAVCIGKFEDFENGSVLCLPLDKIKITDDEIQLIV